MLSIKAENEVNCYFKQLPTWFFITFNSLKNLTNYGSIDLKSGGGFRLENHPITEPYPDFFVYMSASFGTMAGAAIPIPIAEPIIGTGFGIVFGVILERGMDPLKNNAKGLVGL